jgi:uncharacterized membrane protein
MKRQLITGLLIWLPVWAVYVVIKFIFDIFDNSLSFLPHQYQPATWLGFNIPGIGLILTLALIWFTGALTANFIGRKLIDWWEKLLNKIPLVRTVYSTVQQLLNAFVKPKEESFRQVVLVEYPRRNSWSIGFLTGQAEHLPQEADDELVSVFIPTTPNPTSGFLIFVPKKEVKMLQTSVEDAFRMIVSLGVVQPIVEKVIKPLS